MPTLSKRRAAPRLRAAILAVAMAAATPQVLASDGGEADYAAARTLIDEHRDADARERLLAAGRAGHVRAAATLGMMALLSPGWSGAEPPAAFARAWLGRAAIAGDPAASHVLAAMNAGTVRMARRGDAR